MCTDLEVHEDTEPRTLPHVDARVSRTTWEKGEDRRSIGGTKGEKGGGGAEGEEGRRGNMRCPLSANINRRPKFEFGRLTPPPDDPRET